MGTAAMTLLFSLLTVAAQLAVVGLVGLTGLRRLTPAARLRAPVLRRDQGVRPYALALALAGLPISAYHYLVERFPGLEAAGCSPDNPLQPGVGLALWLRLDRADGRLGVRADRGAAGAGGRWRRRPRRKVDAGAGHHLNR